MDLPRDAFFGPTEMVPADKAAGRVSAEQLTPYPPGIPRRRPRRETEPARRPDASDSKLEHFKVVA